MWRDIRSFILRDIGIVPFLFSTLMVLKVFGFSVGPADLLSYAAMIVMAVVLFFKAGRFDGLTVALLAYIPLNIVITQPPAMFMPWLRYGLFLLLLVCVSPFFKSDYAVKFRSGVFKMTLVYCVIIGVVCCLCYFLGINMMKSSIEDPMRDYLVNKAGTFSGITAHSMLLGPIAGIGAIAATYMVIAGRRKKLFIAIALMCTASVLFSASRSSLFAMIVGEISLCWFYTRTKTKVIQYLVLGLIAGALTFPLWSSALEGVNAKNQRDLQRGVNTSSRDTKWEARIAEFEDAPLTGIGFVSVSSRDAVGGRGIVEPGSSWLAILSMTGLVGFTICLLLFLRALKNSLFTVTPGGAVMGGVLVMLSVHMMAEGHIFSAGSYLSFCVWLSVGCCTDFSPYYLGNLRGSLENRQLINS